MSKGYASVTILGSLGKDPEIRSTQSGKKVASFSLAVEDGFGENVKTNWWDVVCWEKLAETAEKYLKKGKTVAVTGKLTKRSWDDKQTGQKREKAEINAFEISFQDTGSSSSGGSRAASTPTPARRETAAPERRAAEVDPFADAEEDPF